MAEAGFPDVEAVTWVGMFAPAGTPRAIVQRLNTEINRIIQEPDIRAKLTQQGIVPAGGTPEELGAHDLCRDQALDRGGARQQDPDGAVGQRA